MQVYPTLSRSEQNRGIFYLSFTYVKTLFLFIWTYLFLKGENPFLFIFIFMWFLFSFSFFFFFFFYEKLREVVSCCKGEWKAIQEKSLSKSENEGFVIQKIQSLKSVFRTTIFFFLTPHFTLTFTFITHTCHFFFF